MTSDKLSNELALGTATERAIESLLEKDATFTPTQNEIEDAQEKAMKMVTTDMEGMQEMRKLSLSIGLPVPRILFEGLVAKVKAPPGRKKVWRKTLDQMSEIREVGCIDVRLPAYSNFKEDTAYLVLEKCDKDHDLTAQLEKIYTRISEKGREEVLRHLSMLIHLGRGAYTEMANKMEKTLNEIVKKLPKEFDLFTMGVDYDNTTLYLPYGGDDRVGIFVHLQSDIDAKKNIDTKKDD